MTAFVPQPCVCACGCGNTVDTEDALIAGFGICDECDYCGPRHGCEHPQHPNFRPNWPNEEAPMTVSSFSVAALPAMLKCAWPRPQIGDVTVTHAAEFQPATSPAPLSPAVLERVLDNYRCSALRGIAYANGAGWFDPRPARIQQAPPTRTPAAKPERKPVNLLSKNGKRLPLRAIPFEDLNRQFWSKGLVADPSKLESTTPRALTLHEKMCDPSLMSWEDIRDSIDYEPLSESRRAWLELGVHTSMIHGVGGGALSLEGYAEGSIGDTLFASGTESIELDGPEAADPLDEFADEASSFGKGIAYETLSPTLLKQIAWEQDMARSGELITLVPRTKPEGGITLSARDWAGRPKQLFADQFQRIGKGAKRALSQTLGVEHGIGDSAEALLERVHAIRADALASGVTIDFESADPDEERERFLAPAPAEWHSAFIEVHAMVEILSEDWTMADCPRPGCSTFEEHRHVRVARKHHRRPQNVGATDEFWNADVFDVAAHELGTHGLVDDLVVEPFTNGVKRTRYQLFRGAWQEVKAVH